MAAPSIGSPTGAGDSRLIGGIQNVKAEPLSAIENKGLDLLHGVSGQLIDSLVKKEQDAAFYQGQARVIQGEAVKQVVEDQPWLSRLFGPDATSRGAQTMGAMMQVNRASSDVVQNMPDWRKLTPDQFGKVVYERQKDYMTGDDATDAVVRAKLMEQSQAVLTQHAKEHYVYVQEQNKIAYDGQARTAASSFNDYMVSTTGKRSAGVDDQQRGNLIASFTQLPGQRDDAYQDSLMGNMNQLARTGQFHALKELRNSGLWNKLSAEQQTQVGEVQRVSENNLRFELGAEEFGLRSVALQTKIATGQLPIDQALQASTALNKAYSEKYGAAYDYITPHQVAQWAVQGAHAKAAAAAAASAANGPAEEESRMIQTSVGAWQGGNVDAALAAPGANTPKIVSAIQGNLAAIRAKGPEGEQLADRMEISNIVRNTSANRIMPQTRQVATIGIAALKSGAPSPQSAELANLYRRWTAQGPEGQAALSALLGDDFIKFDQFMRAGGANPEAAPAVAAAMWGNKPGVKLDVPLSATDKKNLPKQLASSVAQELNGSWFSSPGRAPVGEQAVAVVSSRIESAVASYHSQGFSIEASTKMAMQENPADIIGGKVLAGIKGQVRLSDQLGFKDLKLMDDAFTSVVDAKIKALQGDPKAGYSVMRQRDQNGEVALAIGYIKPDGSQGNLSVYGPEIEEASHAIVSKKRKATTVPPMTLPTGGY